MTYANTTKVSSQQSRMEIERMLIRYGAESFMYGTGQGRAIIAFEMRKRKYKFILPLPGVTDDAIVFADNGKRRAISVQQNFYEQAGWRALALIIRGKLEAVETGIVTFEDEFLAATMLPDGQTVGDWAKPQIALSYERGDMPPLLTDGRRG